MSLLVLKLFTKYTIKQRIRFKYMEIKRYIIGKYNCILNLIIIKHKINNYQLI